jgi:hypothetical protein
VIAASPSGIQPVPANAYWLNWTLPDAGFVLTANSNPAASSGWGTNQLPAPVLTQGYVRSTLLTTNPAFTANPIALPANGSLFFQLQRLGW